MNKKDAQNSNPTLMEAKKKLPYIMDELDRLYPEAECSLDYKEPLQLLISTRLAAQCTDARVNMVTPALFERFPDCRAFAEAEVSEIEEYIRSTGFYHAKAQNIKDCCIKLLEKHGGNVPIQWRSLRRCPESAEKPQILFWETYSASRLM